MPVAAIIMVLLGCADDGDQCQRLGQVPASYTSMAACKTAMRQELPAHSGYDYPVVAARCEPSQIGAPVVIAALTLGR